LEAEEDQVTTPKERARGTASEAEAVIQAWMKGNVKSGIARSCREMQYAVRAISRDDEEYW
jgi:hypothetical protein